MTTQKSFVTRLGELIDSQRAEQREAPQPGSARPHPVLRLLRWFIPNGGTLLIAAVLIFTQRVWAQGSLAPDQRSRPQRHHRQLPGPPRQQRRRTPHRQLRHDFHDLGCSQRR